MGTLQMRNGIYMKIPPRKWRRRYKSCPVCRSRRLFSYRVSCRRLLPCSKLRHYSPIGSFFSTRNFPFVFSFFMASCRGGRNDMWYDGVVSSNRASPRFCFSLTLFPISAWCVSFEMQFIVLFIYGVFLWIGSDVAKSCWLDQIFYFGLCSLLLLYIMEARFRRRPVFFWM